MDSSTTPQPFNWSGYVSETSPNEMVEAWGSYTQPTISLDCAASSSSESTWVGIGGADSLTGATGDDGLIQAGTARFANYSYNGQTLNNYHPWYEYTNGNYQGVAPIINVSSVPAPGDAVHVYIAYQTSNSRAEMDVWVAGTEPISFLGTLNQTEFYDGSSAEWVDEAPGQNNENFHAVTWTDANIVDVQGNTKNLGTTDYNAVEMARYIRTQWFVIANPDDYLNSDGDGFTDNFDACPPS